MKKISCIYKITSPDGKIYIGRTVDLKRRISRHRNKNKSSCCPRLHSSFMEHGFENHTFEVVEINTKEALMDREEFWILHYGSFGENGLNMAMGKGTKGLKRSDDARKKISESRSLAVSQYNLNGEYIKTFPSAVIAAKKTGADSSVIGQCCIGKKMTSGNFLWSREKKDVIDIPDGFVPPRPFKVFKKNGDYIGEFLNQTDCVHLGMIPTNIGRCLNGERASVNGYVVIYSDQYHGQCMKYVPKKRRTTNKKSKAVLKLDLNGNLISEYESITQAAKSEGRSPSDVKKCCDGKLKRSGNYKWRYK